MMNSSDFANKVIEEGRQRLAREFESLSTQIASVDSPEERKILQDRLDVLHRRHRMKVASASEKGFGLNR